MPPKKRKVQSVTGRPPLPPEIRQARQKRCIGIVEQVNWDRWRIAAQVAGLDTTEFITKHVNCAADEILGELSKQQLSAKKRKLVKGKAPKPAKSATKPTVPAE